MTKNRIPSFTAQNELIRLGQNIAIARKRRRMTQQRLADGASINVHTVRRLENGEQGVSLGALAMVLLVLGESGRLGNMLDVARDDIGLLISVRDLPKRVRTRKLPLMTTSSDGASANADRPGPVMTESGLVAW